MKTIIILLVVVFANTGVMAQNLSLNILVKNSGKVNNGESVFLEVTVCNMDATISVPVYKLRPQISVPSAIVTIPAMGHILPAGWSVTANKGTQIWLSNGTDTIGAGECRTLFIAMQAIKIGGPSTVSGNLLFSNGMPPGSVTGSQTPGDSPADNSSASTVEVLKKINR
jgi:hypothetical protein